MQAKHQAILISMSQSVILPIALYLVTYRGKFDHIPPVTKVKTKHSQSQVSPFAETSLDMRIFPNFSSLFF